MTAAWEKGRGKGLGPANTHSLNCNPVRGAEAALEDFTPGVLGYCPAGSTRLSSSGDPEKPEENRKLPEVPHPMPTTPYPVPSPSSHLYSSGMVLTQSQDHCRWSPH